MKEVFVPLFPDLKPCTLLRVYSPQLQSRRPSDQYYYDPLHTHIVHLISMCGCKRSFGNFAVPLSPFKARYSNEELNAQKPEVQPVEQDFRARGRDAFMNDESLAETGYSWENFIFGGALHIEAYDEHSSLSIMPWPNLQQFESFMAISARMSIRYFGQLEYSRHLAVQPCQYGEFLHQKFWDEEKPDKVFKKMWLKPYLEAPQHETEFTYFNSGHEAPIEVSAKKRRLSNAAMDRARAYASKLRRSERMARADRWHRCREILLERKSDFHDRAKDRLNALWTSCTPAIGEKMFRQ